MNSPEIGDLAPAFSATTTDGKQISLADFKGNRVVVLFFYPRDNSLVCTQEACSFRDAYEDFVKLGAVVIGVSGDSDESHRSFAATQRLPFSLIADEDGALQRLFGVAKSMFVVPGRVTFVIDRAGIIVHKFNSQFFGSRHAREALEVVKKLTA